MPGSQDPRILSSCFSPFSSHCLPSIYFFLDAFLKPVVFHIFWSWVEKCTTRWIKRFINYRASQAGLADALERTWFHRLKAYCDFALSDIPAAWQQWQPRLQLLVGDVAMEPELCRGVWCQSGQCWWEQSRGSSTALLPQGWDSGSASALGLGPRQEVLSASVLWTQWSNQAVTVAEKSNGRANNQAELSLLHLCFLSGLCQSVGPGNLLMVKEGCVFTVLKVDLMGKFRM